MTAEWWTVLFAGVTAVFTGVLAVTGIWALVYASQQLRQARESEKVQHLLRFVDQFDSSPMVSSRKSLAEKRLNKIEDPPELDIILNFFETIALLVKRNYLDLHDVWDCFSYWMLFMYADSRESLEQERENDPTYYADFVALVDRLKQIEKVEGAIRSRPSEEEIVEFWNYELGLAVGLPSAKHLPRKAAERNRTQNPSPSF